MNSEEFPKIQRGNGVMNDNLATLGDIMTATLQKVRSLEGKIDETKQEVVGVNKTVSKVNETLADVKKTIEVIDKESTPREKKSFKLLIASVIISAIGLILAYLALK